MGGLCLHTDLPELQQGAVRVGHSGIRRSAADHLTRNHGVIPDSVLTFFTDNGHTRNKRSVGGTWESKKRFWGWCRREGAKFWLQVLEGLQNRAGAGHLHHVCGWTGGISGSALDAATPATRILPRLIYAVGEPITATHFRRDSRTPT